MQDAHRRFVCYRSAQRDFELFLVRVGHRQPEDLVPVPARGQRVDQWLNGLGIIADEKPGIFLAGFRGRRDRSSGFLPANLVAGVRDGLGFTLLVMLCSKLFQHIDGLLIAARTVEQRSEFLDPAVLEKPDGFGTHGMRLSLGGPDSLLTEPELRDAGTDRWAGRACRAGSCCSAPKSGRWPSDVRVGKGLGDLAVVGGVSAQRRDRPRCGGRVGPCPHGRGGEHRLRADLQQHRAAEIGQCVPHSWRIRPAAAHGDANRRRPVSRSCRAAAPVRLHTNVRCGEPNSNRLAYDSNSSRTGSSSAEWKAWLVSSQSHRTPSAVSSATARSRSCAGPDSTVLAPL